MRLLCTAPHVTRPRRPDVLVVGEREQSVQEMLEHARLIRSRDWHTQTERGLAEALVAALEEIRERRAAG